MKSKETNMTTLVSSPEINALTTRSKSIWMAGDYDHFSCYMESDARAFYERLKPSAGSRFLDVSCGSGQLALLAARDGLAVTGADIASNLIERARLRAHAEALAVRFEEADAAALPFDDAGFDVVASLVGAMFAPRPQRLANELLRVCRPGGTIAMANWTPQGVVGKMFKIIWKIIAPPGMPSPLLWGDETTVRKRFGAGFSYLSLNKRYYTFNYPFPPSEVVEFYRLYYGPTNRAFASLDGVGCEKLRRDLAELCSSHNRARAGRTTFFAEYLEVVGIRA
jgi:SAM-dependent methyltransferase